MSIMAVSAPVKVCEAAEDSLYKKPNSVLYQSPSRHTHIVLGDFKATNALTKLMCWSLQFWYQEWQQLMLFGFCKIQET